LFQNAQLSTNAEAPYTIIALPVFSEALLLTRQLTSLTVDNVQHAIPAADQAEFEWIAQFESASSEA